jgi:hypothetical protein
MVTRRVLVACSFSHVGRPGRNVDVKYKVYLRICQTMRPERLIPIVDFDGHRYGVQKASGTLVLIALTRLYHQCCHIVRGVLLSPSQAW